MPPSPLLPPSLVVATGRLGRLRTHAVVDDAIGAMLGAVERVDVASPALALVLQDTLASELHRWTAEIDHVNVFQYDTARVAPSDGTGTSAVELLATRAVAKHLHSIVREFGRLHASVVRQYMRAIVRGLHALHQHGLSCGGLSLSNLFLSEGRAQIGAWFPPIETLQQLCDAHATLFADNPFAKSVLRRHGHATVHEWQQRDLRSLAFLLVEMLTGTRVMLSQLTGENDELLKALAVHSMEQAFALELMQPNASLKTLETHPYLADDRLPSHATLAGSCPTNTASQRELIAHLIDKELTKCRELQRTDAQQVRAWFAQFEKKFHRKPHTDERPASIQRLQQRCRALHERIQELERRAKVLNQAAQSGGRLVGSSGPITLKSETKPHASSFYGAAMASFSSALDIDTSSNYVHTEAASGAGFVDHRRRSPAQNAFLRNLSNDNGDANGKDDASPTVDSAPRDEDITAARERGHELLHQRKGVMGVILGLEQ